MRKKTVLRIAKLMLALFMFFSGFRLPVIRAEDTSSYGELVTDLSTLKDGDRIIIVNKSANMAMSQTASTSNSKFRSGVSVTPTDGMIDNPPDDIIWTLHVVDGGYTFTTADGSKRLSRPDKTQTVLDATSNYYIWAITDVADSDVFYIDNTGPSEKGHYRLHWNTSNNQIWWNVLNEGKTGPEWQQNIYVVRNNTISPPVIETCTVMVNDSDNGSISVSNVEDGVAIKGSDIVITAHPDADYELLSLLINEVEHANEFEDNQLTVTVNEDLTIRALFKLIREPVRYITVLPSEHGRVYTDFSVFENDQAMPIYVEPDEGYELTSLLITHGDTTEDIANPPAGVTYGPYELNGRTYYDFTVDWDITIQGVFEKIGSDEPTVSEGLVTDLSQLIDGSRVVIYNPGHGLAMTSDVLREDWYLAGGGVTITDNKVVNPPAKMLWDVSISGDVYTFSQGDKKVTAWLNGSYAELTSNASHSGAATGWKLSVCNATNHTYFMASSTLKISNKTVYVEVFKKTVNNVAQDVFCAYTSNSPGANDYGMQFYLIAHEEETPEQPDEQTYGFTNTLETGDKVIILNREYNKALSSTIVSNFYLTGTDLTPVDGVITTDKTDVVWEVTKNSDGTYLFTQGTKVLGGIQAADNNNNIVHDFVFTDAQATKWTVDKTVNGTQLYLGELPSNKNGHVYLEWDTRTGKLHYTLFDYANPGADTRFIYAFYKQGAEAEPEVPADPGDLVTDLSQLTDGAKVAIYSPTHLTAISTRPNGDWYLRANNCTVVNGKVVNFTSDFVWTVKVNEDGSYSFISNDDPTQSLAVWPSQGYAEVTVEYGNHTTDGDNTWKLDPAKTANCWYISSMNVAHSEKGKAYLEAFYKNYVELFSGYFINPTDSGFKESDFALQFYLVDPNNAVPPYDDGVHDGVMQKGEKYIFYNPHAAKSLGLYKAANYAMDAIDTEIRNNLAYPGNGAYVVTVDDTLGRYYTFTVNGRYLVTNTKEELLFIDKPEDGTVPEEAKWYLVHENKDGFEGYFIFNKECRYNGYPVCIEYFSSVFSGWTYNKNNKLGIYLFKFYKLGTDVEVREDIVQAPAVIFDCWDSRCIEQNFPVTIALDDLAEDIAEIRIKYLTGVNGDVLKEVTASDYEVSSDKKTYSFTIAAEDIDGEQAPESFKIIVEVKNSYDIEYSGEKTVVIEDKPFFEDMTPAPNAQTRDDKRPVISVKVGNVGDNPKFEMTLNEVPVEAVFNNGILSYQASEDMEDGLTTVYVKCTRADEVSSDKSWNFTVGVSDFQLYFGQLHSHTTYSDGSGDLTDALEYIASLPASANVQFVAFTDHSNYFDSESAYNPAAAMNDASLMQEASRDLWNEYRDKIAAFNNKHTDLLAIAGYEMTWSGGPGHINSYNTNGLVSRNNPQLDNKSGDAGMKLYYETIKEGENTLHQFNHPGNTFGNFSDFAYWDEKIDSYMFLVEVGNGEGQIGSGGYYPSYEQYILALDNGWHLAPTNNQDNHKGRWGNANDARDVVLTNDFSVEGIYDAIRNLRVYATEDKNLQIGYTVNEQPMGTIFDDNNKVGEKMNVLVTLFDPDAKDSITKVELVRDGGVTAYTWTDEEEIAGGILTVELAPEYCYYFVRVTQADGDLAVTAPIWTRSAYKVGIQSLSTDAEDDKVYTNEEFALTATLYNNEDQNAKVTSVTFTIDGNVVLGSVTDEKVLPAGGTVSISLDSVKLTDAKLVKITATAIVEIDGKQYTYTKDLSLEVTDKENENKITPISEVRAASDPEDTGYIFNIEGVVSSNASGYDKATAFFDCIYVQDATGGICCFPVSGQFKVGDKVRIHGYTDFYQGEPELQVLNIEIIEKLETPYELETTEITSEQLNDRSAEGMLITLKGTVESYELVNGLVQTIMVRDAEGNLGRVFIDGYITKENEVENLEVGGSIEVTGLASYDDSFAGPFPRIRVRDRADVVCDHLWGDVEYIWSNDNTTCTAIRVCQANSDHKETETVECQVTVIEPTATEDGRIIYTATFQNPAFEKQEKEVKGDPATGQVGAEYTVDTGADSTWIKGSEENLLIVVHRSEDDASTFGHFVRIEVDGNIVAPDNYEAEPGSLKATVKAEYLETLEEGGHEVKVVFDDGKAETTLTIATEASGGTTPVTPDTGDYSHLGLYITVMAVSLMMELALYCSLKRRQDRAVS